MQKKERVGIRCICKRCGRDWIYTGPKRSIDYPIYTSCPNCSTKVKIPFLNKDQKTLGGESKE